MFKSKSNLKHFINLLNFFLKNYFFCRKSISDPADGPWLKSIFFYSNGFLFWLRKKIMEHLSVLADIYSINIISYVVIYIFIILLYNIAQFILIIIHICIYYNIHNSGNSHFNANFQLPLSLEEEPS